jgi:3-polyprenyl-4-hydroxybenzoate decarboxylase
MQRPRLIIGISGATGIVYGIRLLQIARVLELETHLVVTKAGERTLAYETNLTMQEPRSMAAATENGAILFPPVPAFYTRPDTVADIVDRTVGRVLDLFGLDSGLVQ